MLTSWLRDAVFFATSFSNQLLTFDFIFCLTYSS